MSTEIEVRSLKYDGSLRRSWRAQFLRHEDSLLVLDGVFDSDVEHDLLGTIARGTHSLEYYWLDRWYNIFRFAQHDGQLRNFYCNINVPPRLEGDVLSYVDLDLDILVEPDFRYRILDAEDFEKNAVTFEYSEEVQTNARQAVTELVDLILKRGFPFNV